MRPSVPATEFAGPGRQAAGIKRAGLALTGPEASPGVVRLAAVDLSTTAAAALAATPGKPWRVERRHQHGVELSGAAGWLYAGTRPVQAPGCLRISAGDLAAAKAATAVLWDEVPGTAVLVSTGMPRQCRSAVERRRFFQALAALNKLPAVRELRENSWFASPLPSQILTVAAPSVRASLDDPGQRDPRREQEILRLLGAGLGLTPSGDDALVAWIAASYTLWGRPPAWAEAVLACLSAGRASATGVGEGVTTPSSAAYLRYATRGEFSHPLATLLSALIDGVPSGRAAAAEAEAALTIRVRTLAAVGSTSGADALAALTCLVPPSLDPVSLPSHSNPST